MITAGRVCVKTTGRNAGEKVVVVEEVDDNYVVVFGPASGRKKCNRRHLLPTEKVIDVKGKKDDELLKALEEE